MYWEELPAGERAGAESSRDVPLSVRKYLRHTPGMTPKERLFAIDLLAGLSEDPALKAFYFHHLNTCCLAADGATAEVMGKYCIKAVVTDPAYVMGYLAGNPEVRDRYAQLMGMEFYFKAGGVSQIELDYDHFCSETAAKLAADSTLCEAFGGFCDRIGQAMKAMY